MNRIGRFKRALSHPQLFVRGANRLYHQLAGFLLKNQEGVDVFKEDWDNLVILDACRYDMFRSTNNFSGTLSARRSKGSATTEWLRANIDGYDLRDTVYVTANPQLERNRKNWDVNIYEIINLWLDEGWDENAGTVLAETVTNAAIETYERFSDKRLAIHYMQPHYPFVRSDSKYDKHHLKSIEGSGDEAVGENVWNQKFLGDLEVSDEELWSMYVENLKYVLKHVEELLETIPGKTVVTSDHGNYVGERASPFPIREYGHPRGLYDDSVVLVPWLEIIRGDRREIQGGRTEQSKESVEADKVTERLKYLGYRE